MRTIDSKQQAGERPKRGLALLKDGLAPKQVASRVGATVRPVKQWAKDRRDGVRREQRQPELRLNQRHVQRLARQLQRGACAHGYAKDHWTLDRIAPLIWHCSCPPSSERGVVYDAADGVGQSDRYQRGKPFNAMTRPLKNGLRPIGPEQKSGKG